MLEITNKQLLHKHPFKVEDKVINDIWYSLNQKVIDNIIESGGQPHKFYGRFGFIYIKRFKSKIRLVNGKPRLSVNWAKTKKLRKEGALKPDKFSYNLSEYIYDIKWGGRKFKGHSGYKFEPSRTNGELSTSGFKNKLWKFLTSDSTNYLKFPLSN